MSTSSNKPRLLLGNVGTRYLPGVKETLAAAVDIARAEWEIDVVEQPNICITPYMGLATMRNRLVMRAIEGEYDRFMLLDNDVELAPSDCLASLLRGPETITIPYLVQEFAESEKLMEPVWPSGSGMKPLDWGVFSCILFSSLDLDMIGMTPFTDTFCYCEEETTCQRWRLQGESIWQNTDVSVRLLRPPIHLWKQDLTRKQTPGDMNPEYLRSKPPPGPEHMVVKGGFSGFRIKGKVFMGRT